MRAVRAWAFSSGGTAQRDHLCKMPFGNVHSYGKWTAQLIDMKTDNWVYDERTNQTYQNMNIQFKLSRNFKYPVKSDHSLFQTNWQKEKRSSFW